MSNIYSYSADLTADAFAPYVDIPSGEPGQVMACIVSGEALSDAAASALISAVSALGYGTRTCAFVAISAVEGLPPLDARALFTLVEGLDPLLIVGADAESVRLLSQAYRTELPALPLCERTASPGASAAGAAAGTTAPGNAAASNAAAGTIPAGVAAARLLGRNAVGFASFESMLSDPDAKQRAWAHLKKLPRF